MNYRLLLMLAFVFVFSCKKKEVADCEKNQWGWLRVNFTDKNNKHSVIITFPGTTKSREKIFAAGVTSDTMRMAESSNNSTGTYSISVSAINSSGAAINQTTSNAAIITCTERVISVNF